MNPQPDSEAVSPPFPPPEPPAPAPAADGNPMLPPPRSKRVRRLTLRQDNFCAYYVANGNAAEAARKAGYTERTAHNQGYRLLKDARVQARIRAVQTEIADSIDPGLILGRLDDLYLQAERGGDYREAARILESMSRLVGFDFRGAAVHLRTPQARDENDDK